MRSVFLAGCVTLALPGLAASGSHAVQAWTAWQSARAAAQGAQAVGEAMRASALLMAERGQLQAAAFEAAPDSGARARAAAASDAALERTSFALAMAGLPVVAVERARETVAAARGRATDAARKGSALRTPLEQFARTIEALDVEASCAERDITLASPSVGVVVGLARTAGELRGIAGRRGLLLNYWLGGRELAPAQKDELLVLTGRLAGAWDRLQRGVRAAGPTPALLDAVASTDARFFGQEEPWYRELVKTAAAGAERPLTHAQYRRWSVQALEALLPVRDALVAEAAAQGEAAAGAARRNLLAGAGVVAVSLGLVVAAVLALLHGLVEPVRGMTAAMTALAAGDLAARIPARGRLREIGAMAGAVAVFRDNLARLHRREAELRRTNLLFAAAVENMSHGLAMYDPDERLAVFNRRFCEVTGLPPERVRPGMAYRDVVALAVGVGHYPGRSAEQAYAERRDCIAGLEMGDRHDELTGGRAVSVRYGPIAGGGWVSTFEDVTERRATEARIVHMAHHDALTGLPNRVLFHEHLQRVLARVRRGRDEDGQFAVLCLDLDGFKGVNDTLGHPVGDELLRQVAHRLRETVRETDLVARLGGDEFAIVQADAQQPAAAALLAERLVTALRVPFDLQGQRVEIGTSIGVVLADEASVAADELLRNADIALYRAKAAGRGTWRFFERGMDAEIQRRRVLETDLKHALAEGQFEIHYQALVAAGTRAPTGFEALLRWRHPERGLVLPAEFIPLAEETGLIRAIGTWVLTRACADAALWPGHVKVAVNLSPAQFAKGKLVRQVERALAASGLAPRRLELEITESVLLQDSDATLGTLHRLRSLGVSVSMDDFGTGYSSLSYLRRFPFDKIKLDQSFVRDLDRERGSLEIVRAVVGLGKALGMAVLAEGVETEEQLGILRGEGCDELQGYLFSRPRPARDVPAIIAGHSASKGISATGPTLVVDNAADGQAVA